MKNRMVKSSNSQIMFYSRPKNIAQERQKIQAVIYVWAKFSANFTKNPSLHAMSSKDRNRIIAKTDKNWLLCSFLSVAYFGQ